MTMRVPRTCTMPCVPNPFTINYLHDGHGAHLKVRVAHHWYMMLRVVY